MKPRLLPGGATFGARSYGGTGGGGGGGGNTPITYLGANLLQWLETNRSETTSGGFVTALTDQSGNGYNYSAASTQQPLDEAGGWNGQRSWAFDGSNDFFTDTNSGAFATAAFGGNDNDWTVWIAGQYFSLPAAGAVMFSAGAGASTPLLDFFSLPTTFACSKNSGVAKSVGTPGSDTLRHVWRLRCTGTQLEIAQDGVVVTTLTDFDTNAATFTKDAIGCLNRTTASLFFYGRMVCRVTANSGSLTTQQLSDMDGYMTKFTQGGAVPMLLITGDSLSTLDKWPVNFAAAYPSATMVDASVGGMELIGYGLPNQPRDGWSNFDPTRPANLLSCQWGSNDIKDNFSGSTVHANYQTYVSNERAKNPTRKILVSTMGWRIGLTTSQETERQAFNTLMRADMAGADYLLDRDVILTSADYPTLMPDGTHPNAQGNTYLWTGRNGANGIATYVAAAGF